MDTPEISKPARPATSAGRGAIRDALLLWIAARVFAFVGRLDPELASIARDAVMEFWPEILAVAIGAYTAARKSLQTWLARRAAAGQGTAATALLITAAFMVVVPLLLVGCGTSSITVYRQGESTPAASVEQKFAGRGCISVQTKPGGATEVLLAQDGTSDWSISRLFAFVADAASAVFGGSREGGPMQGPGAGSGCAQIFEQATPL